MAWNSRLGGMIPAIEDIMIYTGDELDGGQIEFEDAS